MSTTRTIDAPGATVTYDVHEGTGEGHPLLLIGSPMDATGFTTLREHFGDRTVITYDPRGTARSTRHDGSGPLTPQDHAADLHLLVTEVGGPVDVFASSAGAVTRWPG